MDVVASPSAANSRKPSSRHVATLEADQKYFCGTSLTDSAVASAYDALHPLTVVVVQSHRRRRRCCRRSPQKQKCRHLRRTHLRRRFFRLPFRAALSSSTRFVPQEHHGGMSSIFETARKMRESIIRFIKLYDRESTEEWRRDGNFRLSVIKR